MKKIITLTLALLVTTGIAFGQHNNVAMVEQINANNQGDIEQVANTNEARIGKAYSTDYYGMILMISNDL